MRLEDDLKRTDLGDDGAASCVSLECRSDLTSLPVCPGLVLPYTSLSERVGHDSLLLLSASLLVRGLTGCTATFGTAGDSAQAAGALHTYLLYYKN